MQAFVLIGELDQLGDGWRDEANFPASSVPLSDIGDGHFYLYDNHAKTILIWASPNGGIVKEIKSDLEEFLISLLFG